MQNCDSENNHAQYNDGSQLEEFVFELYKDLGYVNVERNIILRKGADGSEITAQIDLLYMNPLLKRYVECKDYSSNIQLDEVAKFSGVLDLFNIPNSCGEFITTSDFSDRAYAFAKSKGIRLINGLELQDMSMNRFSGMRKIIAGIRLFEEYNSHGIQGAIKYVVSRMSMIESVDSGTNSNKIYKNLLP